MYRRKLWNLCPPHPSADELARSLKVSPLVGQMLLNRGVENSESARAFLNPSLKALPEPSLLPGVTRAAERIARAIRDKQRIVIYGDYDVDGITATTILWHAIKTLGGEARSYIPRRLEEGYGINREAVAQIISDGADLIVSVDCGITAIEPAAIAREKGVDIIITDHHEWHGDPPQLPDCYAIVHPRLPSENPYPNPNLCGAGVALKLAWGVGQAMSGQTRVSESFREFLIDATALAALGTIADVVPLVGENRLLAHFGLGGLTASKLTGIRALIDSAELTGRKLDSYDVGFILGPRLNAVGRMGHAALAVEMFTTATPGKATEIAVFLQQQNRARQTVEKKIVEEATAQVEQNRWIENGHRALVLCSESWHAGVIGIVASRMVERYCRPVVMIACTGGFGQGSARSVAGFHLARALDHCSPHLISSGGHEMAAGLRIETGKINAFRDAMSQYAGKNVTDEMLLPNLSLECLAQVGDVTEALVRDIDRMGPFGQGNRQPLLCMRQLEIAGPPRRVGKSGEHLQITVRQASRSLRCIAFNHGELMDRLTTGTRVDLAAEAGINEYNGRKSVELQIKDICFSDEANK